MRSYLFLIPLLPLFGFLFNFTVGVRLLGTKAGGRSGEGAPARPASARGAGRGRERARLLRAFGAGRASGARGGGRRDRRNALHLAARRGGRDRGAARRGCIQRRVGLPAGPAVVADGARRDVRRLPDPRLLDRLHGPRPRLPALLGVPEPVHVRDADAGAGGELRGAVRRLGGRRPLLLPADRVLVRRSRARPTPARRRSSSTASATPASCSAIFLLFVTFGTLDFRSRDGGRRRDRRSTGSLERRRSRSRRSCSSRRRRQVARRSRSSSGCPTRWTGPTPVSALIHAATMVTAGVYMVAALGAALRARAGRDGHGRASSARVTALFAATIALVQNDIKTRARLLDREPARLHVPRLRRRRLRAPAIFHLFTHAFFKALLFLGAGSVIHALQRRAGHAPDGRPARAACRGRTSRCSWAASRSPASRRSPASSRRTRSCGRPSAWAATAATCGRRASPRRCSRPSTCSGSTG